MLYVFVGKDAPDSLALRQRVRPRHLERMQGLVAEGRLAIAGPCPVDDAPAPGPGGISGSVIIAEFPSLDEARRWIADDPYVTEGVFASVEVRPFIKVLP
jgi:uncharacterized protein YciI